MESEENDTFTIGIFDSQNNDPKMPHYSLAKPKTRKMLQFEVLFGNESFEVRFWPTTSRRVCALGRASFSAHGLDLIPYLCPSATEEKSL